MLSTTTRQSDTGMPKGQMCASAHCGHCFGSHSFDECRTYKEWPEEQQLSGSTGQPNRCSVVQFCSLSISLCDEQSFSLAGTSRSTSQPGRTAFFSKGVATVTRGPRFNSSTGHSLAAPIK